LITFRHRGSFDKSESFFRAAKRKNYRAIIEKYANQGTSALQSATPKDTGLTSEQWKYEIEITPKGFSIHWTNDNLVEGIPVVILLQYGHGTRSGSFVEGQDFINPAMRPIFDAIAENLWKEVTNL
jgi:hypothetical protein